MTRPEYEHPGVYVDETGGGRPIEGVPTDALTWSDRAIWRVAIIGGIILAGLGFGLAFTRGNVVEELFSMPGGEAGLVSILAAALLLGALRVLMEWRRRAAGRPPLQYGKLAFGVLLFQLATLVAVGICVPAWLGSLLVAPAVSWDLWVAVVNVLVGCVFLQMAGRSVRDLMMLIMAH